MPLHAAAAARYRDRLSGPLRDRLDLTVDVPALPLDALAPAAAASRRRGSRPRGRRTGAAGRAHAGDGIATNAELTPALMAKHCAASAAALRVLRSAMSASR
jgi:magnesium chelatase family protein